MEPTNQKNSTGPWLIIIIVLVLGVVAYIAFGSKGESVKMIDESKSMMEKDDAMMDSVMEKDTETMMEEKETSMMDKSGTYEAYSGEKLAKANDGDVVLFFRASWCPTCRALDADIKSHLDNIPAGLAILDVDYDNSKDLKVKYGVTYQHTLVQVDANGNLIKKWSGSPTLTSLVSEIK